MVGCLPCTARPWIESSVFLHPQHIQNKGYWENVRTRGDRNDTGNDLGGASGPWLGSVHSDQHLVLFRGQCTPGLSDWV